MEENKRTAWLNYQTNLHHKQALRRHIKPQLIDQLQISSHPSQNYKKAYQKLYLDQVQKSVQDQSIKKLKKKLEEQHAKYMYNQNQRFAESRLATLNTPTQDKNLSPIKNYDSYFNQISNTTRQGNQNFVDFAQNKDRKIQQLVDKNYDGGQSFYLNHQKYLQNKMSKNVSLKNILKDQIQWKAYQKSMEKDKINLENQSFQYYTQVQNIFDKQKRNLQNKNMQDFRSQLIKQIENEKNKRNQKNVFSYQNISRHNPITNPIEYHIDNPYILKKIQDKANIALIR